MSRLIVQVSPKSESRTRHPRSSYPRSMNCVNNSRAADCFTSTVLVVKGESSGMCQVLKIMGGCNSLAAFRRILSSGSGLSSFNQPNQKRKILPFPEKTRTEGLLSSPSLFRRSYSSRKLPGSSKKKVPP